MRSKGISLSKACIKPSVMINLMIMVGPRKNLGPRSKISVLCSRARGLSRVVPLSTDEYK